MNSFDRKLFYKEFPFLHTIARDPEFCENIVVRRTNPDMLQRTPEQCKIVGPKVMVEQGDEVFLFSRNGQPLGQVRTAVKHRCQQGGEAPTRPGETVLEAIYRLNIIAQVHYVGWVAYGYHITDHHSGPEWAVTIYKPAKQVCLAELVAEAEGKSAARVRAQVDF